ncbi:sensor histidine kinase [Agrilactobacillus yilanensis]|uniref:histidine kinase n=1 Tax=Agrilactobacillus yilanensis TaxID=2485997 RepID=A0ABW4J8L0_9LACO|nr:HAMP domain-containing sensor histidine kinase [Agrilactobacillus yilanensis]
MKLKIKDSAKKQRLFLFLGEFISFSVLFVILGLVIFNIFKTSVYRNIDQTLDQEKQSVLTQPKQKAKPIQPMPTGKKPPNPDNQPFKAIQLIYNNKGKIINKLNLGERNYYYLQDLKLHKSSVNKKQTIQTNNGTFRTLLIKVSAKNKNKMYAGHYVLILQNIDGELQSLNAFIKALSIAIGIFWLLALIFSYGLSYWSMRPILRAWQRQKEFTADAAHELRAPLAVIQSQQEYLLTKPDQVIMDVADEISETLNEIKRLQTLTDNLLVLARTDVDQMSVQKQITTDLTWLSTLAGTYQEIASSQQKALTYQIDEQVTLKIDVKLIKQLVIILLNNALQYTNSHDSIWISGVTKENYYELTVGDSGLVISDGDKRKIFDRFYRADAARNKYTGGNGLGLTIAQWIVRQHHGTIKVEDVHPKGACFIIRLPY